MLLLLGLILVGLAVVGVSVAVLRRGRGTKGRQDLNPESAEEVYKRLYGTGGR